MDTNTFSPLLGFKEQFAFTPVMVNKEILTDYTQVVVCGMGGSAIGVSVLKLLFPSLPITLHNTYGLPTNYNKDTTLFILNSYSGNTEEILESFERAKKDGCNMAAISLGGTLIEKVKEVGGAYIELPSSSLEPRFSIGYQMVSILTLMGEGEKIKLLKEKIALLDLEKIGNTGKNLAEEFKGKYPILYASSGLYPVAYLVKAAINEGAKVVSFVSQIPEANHNELQSFITDDTTNESPHFGFWYIMSSFDHVRIQKRFSVMEKLYREKGFTVRVTENNHTDILSIFELILTGYFMATYMAIAKNIDPYKTPFIAEFKKQMAE